MNELLDNELIEEKRKFKPIIFIYVTWLLLFLIGSLFKILHWPLSDALIIASSSGFFAYNLFCFTKLKGKNITNNIFLILCLAWFVYLFICGMFGFGIHFYPWVWKVFVSAILVFYLLAYFIYRVRTFKRKGY